MRLTMQKLRRVTARLVATGLLLAMALAAAGAYGALTRYRRLGRAVVTGISALERVSANAVSVGSMTNLVVNGMQFSLRIGEADETAGWFRHTLEQADREGWLSEPLPEGFDAAPKVREAASFARGAASRWLFRLDGADTDTALLVDVRADSLDELEAWAGSLAAEDGQDAPGRDLPGAPRPGNAVRVYTLEWDNGMLAAYTTEDSLSRARWRLSREMRRMRWSPVIEEPIGPLMWFQMGSRECLIWIDTNPHWKKTSILMLANHADV
jgi:hypothetical protein